MSEKNKTYRQEGSKLIYTILLNAPRELVWDVWTKPEHLREWFGPDGFTITHKSMAVQPGKEWNFIMHGFGQDFDNKVVFLEVVKPSLLKYRHSDANETIVFNVVATFEETNGKTLLTLSSTFESEEIIAELNKNNQIIEGGKQNLIRLESYLNKQLTIQNK